MRSFPFKALALLAGIWLVIGAVIYFAGAAKPTPDSLAHYADTHPLEGRSAAEREAVLQRMAAQVNGLEFAQRQEPPTHRRLEAFFKTLSPEEQSRYLDLTMPTGFKQMMDAFNKMVPAKRKQMVERALADMRRRSDADVDPLPPADDPNFQKMVDHGMHAFYSEASAETKMDLSPVIEQIQKNLQGLHP